MFNINKTLSLIKGGLLSPQETWKNYLEEKHSWKETAMFLTLPLIVVSTILSGAFAYIFDVPRGLGAIIIQIITSLIGIGIASFIFSYLAGMFEGKHTFSKGFAALSLAAIPGSIGSLVSTLPMVGMIISLGLSILGLVYLYKIIPSYLLVPQGKRVIHFILSLLSTILLVGGFSVLFGLGGASAHISSDKTNSTPSSMFGDIGRQLELMENANNDNYTPPDNRKVSQTQIEAFLAILKKTNAYKKTHAESMQVSMEGQIKDKENVSISDLMTMASGMGSAMSAVNAEMEVVKSAGKNWAEHTWIKEQLRIASIHKDLNDAVKHNYALYKKHAEALTLYGYIP